MPRTLSERLAALFEAVERGDIEIKPRDIKAFDKYVPLALAKALGDERARPTANALRQGIEAE